MKVAIEGCSHGELSNIYTHIAKLERTHGYTVDLLLLCGDVQAARTHADLDAMAVPRKYRRLGDFHKYYLGHAKAPILTIVIGGNHEASNYMWELYHGGWLAPNIYFLGFSGCVQVNGLRIAGLSGIYNAKHYKLGHYERMPYDESSVRSIYHVRQYDVSKLAQLSPPDIFLSHDWPNTIERHGDLAALLRRKPFFRRETEEGTLGSPPLLELLKKLQPKWWFSAHLHTRFTAVYRHDGGSGDTVTAAGLRNPEEIVIEDDDGDDAAAAAAKQPAVKNPDEIKIDDDDDVASVHAGHEADAGGSLPTSTAADGLSRDRDRQTTVAPPRETRFLALDKCLPRRDFLEVIDIPAPVSRSPPRLTFDVEWLAISRALHPYLSTTRLQTTLPSAEETRAQVKVELEWAHRYITEYGEGGLEVEKVQQFTNTRGAEGDHKNPQTEGFLGMMEEEFPGVR